MGIKWKLFAVANYILLLAYGYLLYLVFEFVTKILTYQRELIQFLPVWSAIFVVFLNSALNIYIFHKHLPGKLLSGGLRIFFQVLTILNIIAVVTLLIMIFPEITIEYPYGAERYDTFALIFFIGTIILGGYIIFCQVGLQKYIRANDKHSIEQLISDLGTEES
jgi:hypothetical protein